ncbi:MAG: prenyltransferase [Kiritimatiellia bacterium]
MVGGPSVCVRGAVASRQKPTAIAVWWRSLRPYAFPATLVPSACAALLARRDSLSTGEFSPLASFLAVLVALLLHAAVNVLNDFYDFILGFDRPMCAGSSGLLTERVVQPDYMSRWGRRYLLAALLLGTGLAVWRTLWLLPIGLTGAIGAFFYSHSRGYKYRGWGEPVVFVLMGPMLFGAVYLAASRRLTDSAIVASLPFGCWVATILLVNNLRDIEADKAGGFLTFPARIGRRVTKVCFFLLVAGAVGLPSLLGLLGVGSRLAWLGSFALLPLAPVIMSVWKEAVPYSIALRNAPQQVALAYLTFGILLIFGFVFDFLGVGV